MKNVLQMTLITLALVPNALAQDRDQPKAPETAETKAAETKKDEGPKTTSAPEGSSLGLSILGNHEAPKALVLVPWKPSEPGKGPEISTKVDDSRNPIDKEVLERMLRYQEIAKTNVAPSVPAPAPAEDPRKK
jgi:hypothetical protein